MSIDLVTGTDESRRAAREAHRREDRLRIANKNGWPELRRTDLSFGRHHIEHTPTGELYHVMAGEVAYGVKDGVDAWYVTPNGDVVFLQRPSGAKTVDELAERRAAKRASAPERRRPKGVA